MAYFWDQLSTTGNNAYHVPDGYAIRAFAALRSPLGVLARNRETADRRPRCRHLDSVMCWWSQAGADIADLRRSGRRLQIRFESADGRVDRNRNGTHAIPAGNRPRAKKRLLEAWRNRAAMESSGIYSV